MYIQKLTIKNIRSIASFDMTFNSPAGWHVIIGDNGAGKSTIVRAISLGIIGPNDSKALRLNLSDWGRRDETGPGSIHLSVLKSEQDSKAGQGRSRTKPFDAILTLSRKQNNGYTLDGNKGAPFENIWSSAYGWFSCAFGPFRRFTGGEKEWMKVYNSDPRAAAHLSVFGEDVALTEAIDWLKNLHIKTLEKASIDPGNPNTDETILEALKSFLNDGGLLPHGAKLDAISSEGVFFIDGNGSRVDVTQMSDGYRSILSLTFELIRQMVRAYGAEAVFSNFSRRKYQVDLPGVVLIDEIDAHLHPTWQAKIGEWFISVFPKIQFIVTTHSPLICRASKSGSIWRLRAPGSEQQSGEVTGTDKERLLYGDLLDAYGTELFGRNVTQSNAGLALTEELAMLNMKSFKEKLTNTEKNKLEHLKSITSTINEGSSKKDSAKSSSIDVDVVRPLVNIIETAIQSKKPVKLTKQEREIIKTITQDVATEK